MNGYTKLFSSILASSVWGETKETKIVWITMLAMADKNGYVSAAVPGLAAIARLTLEETQEALATLSSPDPHSRTTTHEGRRIRAIDGGWKILNHAKYRNAKKLDERREYLREKQRECRAKKKAVNTVNDGQSRSIAVNGASESVPARNDSQSSDVDKNKSIISKHNSRQGLKAGQSTSSVNKSQQKSTSQQQAEAAPNATPEAIKARKSALRGFDFGKMQLADDSHLRSILGFMQQRDLWSADIIVLMATIALRKADDPMNMFLHFVINGLGGKYPEADEYHVEASRRMASLFGHERHS